MDNSAGEDWEPDLSAQLYGLHVQDKETGEVWFSELSEPAVCTTTAHKKCPASLAKWCSGGRRSGSNCNSRWRIPKEYSKLGCDSTDVNYNDDVSASDDPQVSYECIRIL